MAENNTDEFGEFVETKSGDEFGDFVSTEKKNASLPDSTTPVSQGSEPSTQSGEIEVLDLPQSYQSDRANYKDLVGGKKYNLLRGGKPITGTWDATTKTFIKDPLLNATPQQKKEVGFLQAVEAGVNLEAPVETQEEMFGRLGVEVDDLKKEAKQKISNIDYITSYPSIQRLGELEKIKNSTDDTKVIADADKKIAELRSKKMSDKEFEGIRFDSAEGKVYQNFLPAKQVEEFKGEVKKLPKTDLTVGEAYDEVKDDSDYVQQVQGEIKGYGDMVNQYMIDKLPEETKSKLEALKGTPEYDTELEKELVQSKEVENIIPALAYGLDKKLDALMEVGSNIGLDDDRLVQKKLGDIREKQMFGKNMASTRAEIASSIGGMLPDIVAGGVYSPLMMASMASTMPNDFLEQSIAEQQASGEPIDVNKAKKFALASTAAQSAMLVGAGKLGSHGLNLVGKTGLKRAGELIYEMAKRGTKDAIVFGGLGTVMQNKINKAYDLAENDEYLKQGLHMAIIGGMFALKEGIGKVKGVSKKTQNEVDYLASYLPEEYTRKQIEQLTEMGKISPADGEESLDKLNTIRAIRNQIPADLSIEQMDKIYPLWVERRDIQAMLSGASSEFKSVLSGQIEDIDRKILIKAAVPLTSAEKLEMNILQTGEVENKTIDKARLRYLEERRDAAKEVKEEKKEAEQKEKVEEVVVEEPIAPAKELTPQEEAIKFLDDHAVQSKIDTYGIRPDFRMSSEELERGMKQIREGKLEMVAAKNMLAKIAEWKAQGYVDLIHLKGGTTVRLSAPYEIAEALAKLDEVETKMVAEVHEKVDEVVDQISDEDAQIEVDKILSNFTDANGDIDFIKLKEEYNGFNANILELSSKADEILKAKIDESGTTKENATEGSPTVNTKGAGSEEGDYKTLTEEIEMPDGEKGVKVTIEKPNGEKVELGSMYVEDVESEVAKKIRGFKLSETKPNEKVEEVKSGTPTKEVGEEISFTHAGGNVKGKIVSVENGKYKVKGSDGLNYTVAVENARTPETVEQAKKSIAENMKKLQDLSKPKDAKKSPAPKLNALVPKDVVTAPFKLLGMGDKLIAHVTSKMEDGIAKSFRRGMANSNKYLSRGSSEAQGIFKQLALTEKDIEDRRKGLGQMSAAPLKAVKFYQSGVDIVGKTPESLQNVHQVLDPEVYAKRGLPTKAEADLSPTEKQLYDLLRSTNDMIHDWHYVNGRIREDVYLKNKGTYAPRFYDNIEFADLPNDLKASFEDFSKQQNFSYIKERKNFEDVMAENSVTEDPAYGTSMRLGQMLRNQAIMDYAAVVAAKTKTYSEGDTDIPNSYIKLEGGGKFGNINTYGDLTNKYVPRDIAEDFKGATFINQAMDNVYTAFKWYNRRGVRKLLNKTKTIYNPITQLGNIGSNYVFAMMNGIDPLTYQHRKFEAAKIVKEQGDLYLKLVEEGILGTDITTKDLKSEAKGIEKEKGALGKIDEKITEFYSTRDDIAKVAAYLAHTKDYGRSESDALKRVSEGFQNYNNVGRFYDFASKTPVIGNPFVKFKGDLMRIMKNNFSQRPLTNIAMLAGLNVIASAFSNWSGEDEDVKKAREMRSFIPKVPLPNALGGDIPLVWQTPYGEINAARYFSPFNIYDMGDKGSTVEEVTQFLPYQATPEKPFTKFPDPFLGAYFQVAFDKDFRGKPILDPEANKWREGNADFEEKIQNAATFIARQQIPFYAGADDMLRAYNGEPDYYGRNKDLKQALFSNLIKVEQKGKPEVIADIKKDIDFKLSALDKLNKEVYDAKKLATKNISKINSSTSTNKQILILKEQRRASNKIAEIMDEQAEIKRKLIEPRKMLEKIK